MDADGDTKTQNIKRKRKEIGLLQRYIANVGNVLSALRLRSTFQNHNGYERFVLDSEYNFLLYFRLFLAIVYIAYETLK